MTYGLLKKVFEENHIPDDAELLSDSGCEYDATRMDGIYYNKRTNQVVFTQEGSKYDSYSSDPDWKLIHFRIYDFEKGEYVCS